MDNTSILVVEDHPATSKLIEMELLSLGYSVSAIVTSGREAVNQTEATLPDLVLMDIDLEGEMDGIEAAEEITVRFNIPVLYLTAHSEEATLERAKVTEPYGYLLKPFQKKELYTSIEISLYKHKMEMKLKEREQLLALTLKSIGDAVVTIDEKGIITSMNPSAEELTSWEEEQAIGRKMKEVLKIKVMETFAYRDIRLTKILNRSSVLGLDEDTILISRDGIETPVVFSVAPIIDDNGIDRGSVIVVRDIGALGSIRGMLKYRAA